MVVWNSLIVMFLGENDSNARFIVAKLTKILISTDTKINIILYTLKINSLSYNKKINQYDQLQLMKNFGWTQNEGY